MSKSKTHTETKLAGRRKWLFIFVLTVILPAFLFLLFELGLRIIGYGYAADFFIQKEILGQTVLYDNPKFSLRFFPRKLARPSSHFVIPAEKSSGTFRIFVLGGSAAMGDPDFSFGFSRILEVMLQHQYPGIRFEVINAAITAINSNVVLPIARDCAKLQPDLFIVYLGNNEVIGPYGPGTVFAPFLSSRRFIRTSIFLRGTKIGQFVNSIRRKLNTDEDNQQTWAGVDMFIENRLRFNDPRMASVYDHFRDNLVDICKVGHRAGARVILSTVSTNLKDCPPFGSLHRQDLNGASLNEWDRIYQAGMDFESVGRFEEAIESYLKAAGIDEAYADLHYRLARSYQAIEQLEEARRHYTKARHFDALRFRADTQINEIIRNVATAGSIEGVSLVDAEKSLQAESTHGIPDESLFYDHVHLNFSGNYRLARLMKEQIDDIPGRKNREITLSEAECRARLAFTRWDKYRIEKEILGRMKSPAFANQLDNALAVRRWQTRLDSVRASLRQEALTEAVETYRQAIEANGRDWVLHNNFGLLLLEAGHDPVGAAEQFRLVQDIFPNDYLTYNNLGLAFIQQDNLNEALACFREALRIKPDFPKANYNLGDVLERQGNYEEAIKYYYLANLPKKQLADAHNRFAIRLANKARIDEAVQQFDQALRLWPDSPEAHANLGKVFLQTGRTELAVHHLSEVVRIQPELAEGHIDLASLFFMEKDYVNAVKHFQKAVQIRPDLPEAQNNLGLALCNRGAFEQAIPHFRQALASRHDYVAARNNLAGALSQLGRSEEALAELRESLRTSPDNPNFHNNYGAELLKLGKIEEAISHFRKALQLDPNLESARNNLNYALSRLQSNGE